MGDITTSSYLILAIILGFAACFLAIYGGGEWAAGRLSEEAGVYERFIGTKLKRLYLDITAQEFIMMHIAFFLFALALGYWLMGITGIILGFFAGIFVPSVWLDMQWSKRIDMIEEQVEEAMIFLANSFKANPALPEAIADVCDSMGPPISQEFGIMLKEYKLGTALDNSLINMQNRVPSRNLKLAVSAILIGRTVGGNIPIILEDIASTIRESFRLERVIDTQTAQGKMQAWVMGAAPAVVVGLFYLMDPTLIRPLFNTFLGYIVLSIAITLNIIGVALILKIVRIDV